MAEEEEAKKDEPSPISYLSHQRRRGYILNIPYFTYGPNSTEDERRGVPSLQTLDDSPLYRSWKNGESIRGEKASGRRSRSTGRVSILPPVETKTRVSDDINVEH